MTNFKTKNLKTKFHNKEGNLMKRFHVLSCLLVGLGLICLVASPVFAQEPRLYNIYNTLYGTALTSDQDLLDTYGKACSDSGDPCTQDADCSSGTCVPIDDQVWLSITDGTACVQAGARYAGYTQLFGYYNNPCVGSSDGRVPLFNVIDSGYLYKCSNAAIFCIDDDDCPSGGTCNPIGGDYDADIIIDDDESVGFFDDPSGSPMWFSQPLLNKYRCSNNVDKPCVQNSDCPGGTCNLISDNGKDHMKAYRAADYDPITNTEYLIGWEDLEGLGDADYQDLVLVVNQMEPSQAIKCCEYDSDCDDGINCTDDVCVNHVCQNNPDDGLCPADTVCADYYCDAELDCQVDYRPNGYPCDDGLYCTVSDQCVGGVCTAGPARDCSAAGNQCNNGVCNESADTCEAQPKPNGTTCDDTLYCTVNDQCTGGVCGGSARDCSAYTNQCNNGVCNESADTCEAQPKPNGTTCDDDDVCTDPDACENGVCEGTPIPECPCNTKIYRGGVCEESTPLDTIYNRPGRRGLSITCCEEEQFCVCSSCYPEAAFTWSVTILPGSDPDFTLDDLVASGGTGTTFTLKVKSPCTEHCPDELVELEIRVVDQFLNEDRVIVTIGRVALGLGDTNTHPNTQTVDINLLLWNPMNYVKAIQTDVCSAEKWACEAYATQNNCTDFTCGLNTNQTACEAVASCQWKTVGGVEQCVNKHNCEWVNGECIAVDNLVCTSCVVDEDRTPEYICSANEQADGCCKVTLFSTEPDDLIQRGSGSVATIKYDVLDKKTSKDCIALIPVNSKVADQFNEPLCAVPKAGEICFMICGDVYPQDCYECESCGDGRVDLFDILEEIDIILSLQTASLCQKMCGHGNVPLGMPPYCGNPAGVNPPNCECDQKIDVFDALVIIDKALSKLNCCDYCMFGKIY